MNESSGWVKVQASHSSINASIRSTSSPSRSSWMKCAPLSIRSCDWPAAPALARRPRRRPRDLREIHIARRRCACGAPRQGVRNAAKGPERRQLGRRPAPARCWFGLASRCPPQAVPSRSPSVRVTSRQPSQGSSETCRARTDSGRKRGFSSETSGSGGSPGSLLELRCEPWSRAAGYSTMRRW